MASAHTELLGTTPTPAREKQGGRRVTVVLGVFGLVAVVAYHCAWPSVSMGTANFPEPTPVQSSTCPSVIQVG